jgi:hypothetical protein
MSFGAQLVAWVLGLPEVPVRLVRRLIAGFLIAMMVAMPITFRHGIELFAQREAQQWAHKLIDPLMTQLQRMPTTLTPAPGPTAARPPAERAQR